MLEQRGPSRLVVEGRRGAHMSPSESRGQGCSDVGMANGVFGSLVRRSFDAGVSCALLGAVLYSVLGGAVRVGTCWNIGIRPWIPGLASVEGWPSTLRRTAIIEPTPWSSEASKIHCFCLDPSGSYT